jgi:hypothetical protein
MAAHLLHCGFGRFFFTKNMRANGTWPFFLLKNDFCSKTIFGLLRYVNQSRPFGFENKKPPH